MRLEISTLGRTITALALAALMLVGTSSLAFAQRHRRHQRHDNGLHLGWDRRDDRRDERLRRRALKERRKEMRRAWRERRRDDRREWRRGRRDDRSSFWGFERRRNWR